MAHNAPATVPSVGALEHPTRFAAGMLDGPDLGFFPNNTTIPLGGGFVRSPPILAAGLNGFMLNYLSTTGVTQIFISPCLPGTSADLMTFGDLAALGLFFDETVSAPGPYIFGANPLVVDILNSMVYHTFTVILFNPDLVFDAQIQYFELYANARLST